MSIPTITPYGGGVANPDGSQTQTEFTQNMFDQLSYEAQLASELNATVNATNATASEVDGNAAIAQNSADSAQAAANFDGDFTVGVTSAVKGKSYLYSGDVWLCLQNTTSTPSAGNAAWKLSVGEQYVTEAQEDFLPPGSELFKGSDGVTVKNGDTVPAGTTHLRVLVDGEPVILVAWDELILPATVTSVPVSDNGFSGYDVVTDQGTFEFVSPNSYSLRKNGNVIGFGAKFDGSDDFPSLKKAYESTPYGGKVIVDGGVLTCIDISDFIRIKSDTRVFIDTNSCIKVDSDAITYNGTSAGGYVFNPLFGLENGVDNSVKNFKISGSGKFIIEKTGVTPVFIDVINCEKVHLFCDVDGIGDQLNNKAEYGYFVRQGIRCLCSDNDINNTRFDGVRFEAHERSIVNRNRLTYIGVDAQYPFNDPSQAVEGVHYWNAAAVSMVAQKHCLAKDNDIEITGGAGVFMRSGVSSSICGRVIDNTLQDIGKGAIGTGLASFATSNTESKGHTIRGNKVYGFQQRFTNSGFDLGADGSLGLISDINVESNYVNMFNELKGHDETTYPNHADDFGPFSCLTLNPSSGLASSIKNVTIKDFVGKNAQAQCAYIEGVFDLKIDSLTSYNCARAIQSGIPGVYNIGSLTPYAIFITSCAAVSGKNLSAYNSHKGFVSGNAPVIYIVGTEVDLKSVKVINDIANGFKSAYTLRVNEIVTLPSDISYLNSTNATVVVDDLVSIGASESSYEVFSASSHTNLTLRRANKPVSSLALPQSGSVHFNRISEYFGVGSPEGVVFAPNGAIYRDITGYGLTDRIYEKQGGSGTNTGWVVL